MQNLQQWDLSYTQNRELSWLKFNERVLAEAEDRSVPLIERLRFVAIFSSNLDEFFMVRVGSLCDLNKLTPNLAENKSGQTPAQQLANVLDAVRPLIARRDEIYARVMAELAERGIEDVPFDALTDPERVWARNFYKEHIKPVLSPSIIDRSHPFPHLRNKELYCAALLSNKGKPMLGIVDVPKSLPPIIILPDSPNRYVRTEELISAHIKKLFKIYEVQEHAVISVTRNADISLDEEKFDEDHPDILQHMDQLLKKRDHLGPVRLEMQGTAPHLAKTLAGALKLDMKHVFTGRCPLRMGYAYMLEGFAPEMYNTPFVPAWPEYLEKTIPMRQQIQQRDVLLAYPYQTIQPFLDLLRQSAADPDVLSIKITIYRLARNSAIAKALCEAAENGKEVTVLMELRARFDERNNMEWTREMEEAGCRIIYGPDKTKCHAKICLITRREKNGLSHITQIGTGNYNEKTSALYTDFSLMTADPVIARDAVAFFQNMLIGSLSGEYEKLLVAPNNMKAPLMRMIDREIAKGEKGRIIIKANSVTERDLIDKLSEASCRGVKIDLIIRGICCLRAGVPGKTENITVTSVIGRYLEHSRIYCFGEGEDSCLFISSADIMTRNQTRRVEVGCPITSPEIKEVLLEYLRVTLADNCKAWRMLPDGNYERKTPAAQEPLSVQKHYMEHPIMLTRTVAAKPTIGERIRTFNPFRRR
ncbi:MAG: polyphosphate kinase 1 [Eubacteriales bacterium]|nr:polyphosphate kinase 1 [Eubacteriales bacterium]